MLARVAEWGSCSMSIVTFVIRSICVLSVFLCALSSGLFNEAFAINNKAWDLYSKGEDAYKAKKFAQAESLWKQSVEEGLKNGFGFGPGSTERLGDFYAEQKNYNKAIELYKTGLQVYDKEWSDDPELKISTLAKLSNVYLATQNVAAAENQLNLAVNILKRVKPSIWFSNQALLELVEQLEGMSRVMLAHHEDEKAENLAKNALYIIITMPDGKFYRDEKASCSGLLGRAYLAEKKYPQSIEQLKVAIAIEREYFADVDWDVAEFLNDYHDALLGNNQTKEANRLGAWLYQVWPKSTFKNSEEWGRLFRKASLHAYSRGGSDETIPSARQAIAVARKFGESDIRFGESKARLALFQHRYGDYKEVWPLMETAIACREKAMGKTNPMLIRVLENWATSLVEGHSSYEPAFLLYEKIIGLDEGIAKQGDMDVYKSAKTVADYCKNMLTGSSYDQEKLIPLYERAYKVIAKTKGALDEKTIDCLSDIIYFEKRRVFLIGKEFDSLSAHFQQLLKIEKDAYGAKSPEVRETAADYANLLRRVQLIDEAANIETIYVGSGAGR